MVSLVAVYKWLSFHSIFVAVVVCLALFYAWKAPKQKYPFTGISGLGVRAALDRVPPRRPAGLHKKTSPRVNKSEEKCRRVFENIFRRRFPSVRPEFLTNPVTNKRLELDGFCPSIPTPLGRGLAFEYDGIQHAKYKPYFHRHGRPEFVYQQKRDSWKDLKCAHEGILLIRIPHVVTPENLRPFIERELARKGVWH